MRGFFIITTTSETHKHYQSFACLPGNEIAYYVYNHHRGAPVSGDGLDAEIRAAAMAFRPEVIVYVGACGGNLPSADAFRKLREEVAPTVHFCSDAADDPWWPLLADYERAGAFSLQVALDGVLPAPIAATGLAALTPIDPSFYAGATLPHAQRPIGFGFAGNVGQRRRARRGIASSVDPRLHAIEEMQRGGLQVRVRTGGPENYHEVAEFLGRTRIIPNFARTGSRSRMHVKGRVIEAGLAGALLLEERGSPTANYFTPDVDYVEWDSPRTTCFQVRKLLTNPGETQGFGDRLRARIAAEHSPAAFWGRIIGRLGISERVEARTEAEAA